MARGAGANTDHFHARHQPSLMSSTLYGGGSPAPTHAPAGAFYPEYSGGASARCTSFSGDGARSPVGCLRAAQDTAITHTGSARRPAYNEEASDVPQIGPAPALRCQRQPHPDRADLLAGNGQRIAGHVIRLILSVCWKERVSPACEPADAALSAGLEVASRAATALNLLRRWKRLNSAPRDCTPST